MPSQEMNEKERAEARKDGEKLKECCEHCDITSGECLLYKEMCFFEDDEEAKQCIGYHPTWSQKV